MKLGFEINNNSAYSVAYFYGSKVVPTWNYNSATLDWDKNGVNDVMRDILKVQYPTKTPTYARFSISRSTWWTETGTDRMSAYFSDLINIGKLNINVGVRADRNHTYAKEQTAEALLDAERNWGTDMHKDSYNNMWTLQNQIMDLEVAQAINQFLPDKTRPEQTPQKHWIVFSPTIGLTYDIFGDGKTIAKASYRLFPGSGWGYGSWAPSGTGGWMTFNWIDFDNNYKISKNELYWQYRQSINTPYPAFLPDGSWDLSRIATDKSTNWGGFEWDSPLALTKNYGQPQGQPDARRHGVRRAAVHPGHQRIGRVLVPPLRPLLPLPHLLPRRHVSDPERSRPHPAGERLRSRLDRARHPDRPDHGQGLRHQGSQGQDHLRGQKRGLRHLVHELVLHRHGRPLPAR
jgi:hypothetical protein